MAITHKIDTPDGPILQHDAGTNIVEGVGQLAVRTEQEIPQWFIDQLRDMKEGNLKKRDGEFMLACSVPVVVHHQWLKEGYDCTREPAAKTVARLKAMHLDYFVATNKAI